MDTSETTITEVFSNAIVVISELFLNEVPEDKESFLNRIGAIAEVNVICKSKGTFAAQGSWKKIIAFEKALQKSLRSSKNDEKTSIRCSKENYDSESFGIALRGNSQQALTDASKSIETNCDGLDISNIESSSCLLISENPNAEISQVTTIPISVISATEEGFKSEKRKGNEIYVNITLSSLSLAADDLSVRSDNPPGEDVGLRADATDGIRNETRELESKLNESGDLIAEHLSEKDKRKLYEQQTPYKFFCTMCSFKSKRESHYKKHLQLHKKGATKLFVCIQCGFRTIRMGHLRRHELQHSSQALRCAWCPYTTDCTTFLQRHQRIKHASNPKQLNKKSHGENFLSCSHCAYVTHQPHFLKRHMKVHGIGKDPNKNLTVSYECEKCSYKTRRKEHFERHRRDVHSELRPFLCDACGKAFKRADALRQHRAARHQPFISNEGKIVSGSNSSSTHYSLYCCQHCSKPCRSRAHLRDHLATHSDERSFLCEVCGSSFKTRAVQRKHVATVHANPKAFPCNRCVRRFSTKYALLRHLKIHGFVKDDAARLTTKTESVVLSCMGISQTKAGYHRVQGIESSTVIVDNQQVAVSEDEISINTKEMEIESQGLPSTPVQVSHKVVTVLPILQDVTENKDPSSGEVALEMEGEIHSINSAALTRTPAPSETTTALLYLTHDFTQY